MVKEKSWEEFKESGLFWWINTILHTFGWVIAYEIDEDNKITRVFPARTKYRGFSEKINSEGYKKISKFMKENAKELYNESKE